MNSYYWMGADLLIVRRFSLPVAQFEFPGELCGISSRPLRQIPLIFLVRAEAFDRKVRKGRAAKVAKKFKLGHHLFLLAGEIRRSNDVISILRQWPGPLQARLLPD